MGRLGRGIRKSVLTANSVLYAITAATPAALTMAASRILGRKSSGNTVALTAAELLTIINVTSGADVTGSNAPQAHKTNHQNAGGDEVSVAGLSGLLADDQHVLDAEVRAAAVSDIVYGVGWNGVTTIAPSIREAAIVKAAGVAAVIA